MGLVRWATAGPAMTWHVGELLGLDNGVRGAREPLRGKSTKPAVHAHSHRMVGLLSR